MEVVYNTKFLLRRGTAEAWEHNNPILSYGEPGYDSTNYGLKIGDGKTKWKDLNFLSASKEQIEEAINKYFEENPSSGTGGAPGKDGVSATHKWQGTTLIITSASGTSSANLQGPAGPQGIQGPKGEQGPKGDTPQKYVDYWTDKDKQEIISEIPKPDLTGYATENYVNEQIRNAQLGDGDVSVDLSGYATEQWVTEGFQPKGEYLTKVPEGYAKKEDIPTKPEDIGAQPSGNYLTSVPKGYATEDYVKNEIAKASLSGGEVDLSGFASKDDLPTKVSELENDAGYLTEHQDISGKLDADKLPEAINEALTQAKDSGEFDGKDYILTETDKNEIAEIVADLVEVPEDGNMDICYVAQPEPPENTELLWIDTNDNSSQENVGGTGNVDLTGYAKIEDIPTKPEDIGAQPAGDYALISQIPSVPVESVNNKTGAVTLTATDVGALANTGGDLTGELKMNGQSISGLSMPTANDQAANMSFVNQQMKKAAPRNLLDNSDFRNPVNQRGFTGGAVKPYQYFADRWLNYPDNGEDLDVSISGNGITVSPNGGANLFQRIPDINKFYGKMMTIAVGLSDGTVICNSAIVPSEPWRGFAEVGTEKVRILGHTFDGSRGAVFITPRANVTIAWAALYEGEYTAETLPEYQPKGYGAELAECQRYYYQSWNGNISASGINVSEAFTTQRLASLSYPVTMRTTPTVKIYGSNGEEDCVKEWVSSSLVTDMYAVYSNNKSCVIATQTTDLVIGKFYSYHYTLSADL